MERVIELECIAEDYQVKSSLQAVKDLQLVSNSAGPLKILSMLKTDIDLVLDYIRRLENLNAAQAALIDSANLGVTCNDCPYVDVCIYTLGKSTDCQSLMSVRANYLV